MSSDSTPSVHAIALTVDYDGREISITPTVIETDRGLVLVDVGPETALDPLENELESLGYQLTDIWLVLMTHHDADHAAGLEALRSRVDVPVAAHPEEAPHIEGERAPIKSDPYPGSEIDIELTAGSRLASTAGPVELLETPGHSPGHLSLYLPDERLLIAGDALVSDGDKALSGPKPQFTPEMAQAYDSVEELAELAIDHVVCYHGGYAESGDERIAEIAAEFSE